MSYDYSENILVQESAGTLLHDELGWEVVYAYNQEVLGENGTLGRKDYKEILLTRDIRAALQKFNPWITPAQIDEAIASLRQRLSTASLLQINEEKYALIRDGIDVTYRHPDGRTSPISPRSSDGIMDSSSIAAALPHRPNGSRSLYRSPVICSRSYSVKDGIFPLSSTEGSPA